MSIITIIITRSGFSPIESQASPGDTVMFVLDKERTDSASVQWDPGLFKDGTANPLPPVSTDSPQVATIASAVALPEYVTYHIYAETVPVIVSNDPMNGTIKVGTKRED